MSTASRLAVKGPKHPLFRKFKFLALATPEKYGGSYLKNWAAESPETMVAAALIALSGVVYMFKSYQNQRYDWYANQPYRKYYLVIRPDDPLIEKLKTRPAYYNDRGLLPDYDKPVYELHKAA